jgi:hypothetical protein
VDTTDLAGAYRDVVALAEWATFLDPAEGWPARYVIAHLALTDRALLRGLEEGEVDTTDALDEDRLRAEADPLGALRASSVALVDFVDTIDEDEMKIRVPVTMVEPPVMRLSRRTPVGRLLRLHATVHLPAHLEQLKAMVIRPVNAPGPSALVTAKKRGVFLT